MPSVQRHFLVSCLCFMEQFHIFGHLNNPVTYLIKFNVYITHCADSRSEKLSRSISYINMESDLTTQDVHIAVHLCFQCHYYHTSLIRKKDKDLVFAWVKTHRDKNIIWNMLMDNLNKFTVIKLLNVLLHVNYQRSRYFPVQHVKAISMQIYTGTVANTIGLLQTLTWCTIFKKSMLAYVFLRHATIQFVIIPMFRN